MTPQQATAWCEKQLGKALDFDGFYGAQCVDFFNYYIQFITGRNPYEQGFGVSSAYQLFDAAKPTLFNKFTTGIPQEGDVMIYERGLVGAGGHGHVAIVERATKTTIIVYEQNWGNMFVEKHSRARAEELGYFRYKGLKGDEMLTSQMQNDLIRFLLGRIPNATEKKRIGKHTYAKERKIITDSSEFRNEIKGVKLAGNHLPVEMR